MEFLLLHNGVGKTRRVNWNGKSYLVAPLSMLVPGILAGSEGPLYYPQDEVLRNADDWNHIPIVVYHPMEGGRPVSARSPGVLSKQGIGFVFHAQATDRLTGEGWFDEEATKRVDPRVHEALLKHQPIELSTGLYTQNELIAGNHKGQRYVGIARNYKPDHLAILPDQKGACSLRDGCGVLVNEDGSEVVLSDNFWSDAAREAAAKSRSARGNAHANQASDKANKASEGAKNPPPGKFNETHSNAAVLHKKASEAHLTAARRALLSAGGKEASAAHHAASRAHQTASYEHALIGRGLAANELDDPIWNEDGEEVLEVLTDNKDYALMSQLHPLLFPKGEAGYVEEARNGKVIYWLGGKTYQKSYSLTSSEGKNTLSLGDEAAQEVKSIGGYYRRPRPTPILPSGDGETPPTSNSNPEPPLETPVNRNQMISWLTTNCSCWKDKEDKLALEKMTDNQVTRFYQAGVQGQKAATILNQARSIKINADGTPDVPEGVDLMELAKFLGVDVDPGKDPAGFMKAIASKLDSIKTQLGMGDPDDAALPPVPTDSAAMPPEGGQGEGTDAKQVTGNRKKGTPVSTPTKVPTMAEWLASAPPEAQAVWNHACAVSQQEKLQLVERIVLANAFTPQAQAQIRPIYARMGIPELKAIAAALPPKNQAGLFDQYANGAAPTANVNSTEVEQFFSHLLPPQGQSGNAFPLFQGAAGGPVGNQVPAPLGNAGQDDDDDEPLVPPTINWGSETPKNRRRAAATN